MPLKLTHAHARGRGERDELGSELRRGQRCLLHLVLVGGQRDDRAPFGGLVGQRGKRSRLGQLELLHAGRRDELGRLAVAQGDRAGLVEQQHVDIARRLDGTARHGEHVALHQAVHAGDADRRQQGADRRRDEGDQEGDQHGLRDVGVRVEGERPQGGDGDQEGDRQPGEQDVERDFVGGLAPLGALDQGDHALEERLARFLGHLDHEAIGEQLRASGHGRAVAARLADDGRRLAGDGRLVDRGDPCDDLAVGRHDLAGEDLDHVTAGELGRRHLLEAAVGQAPVSDRRRARRAQRLGLGLAAALGNRLGEVGEEHGQPQPERDRGDEPELAGAALGKVEEEDAGRDQAADLDHEHDRVAHLMARVELGKRIAHCRQEQLAREDTRAPCCHQLPPSLSSARLSVRTFTPGSPSKPRLRPVVFCLMSRSTVPSGMVRTAATRRAWSCA